MRRPLSSVLTALALCAALVLPAGAAAATAAGPSPTYLSASTTAPDPTSSPSTPGPVDPGTGETPAAKETRIDYAPYYIAAVVILALAAAALTWRRVRGGPSSRNLRRADQDSSGKGPDDRRSDH
ncbi:LuxR family transcriptional regulator [Arthrobacter sp. Hor0625]|uniref:LuxR family transcriptional regulator n=1 Tax=Arthrobacter sp. Hor0625 TaxID=3457358 RepID=UPI00403E4153